MQRDPPPPVAPPPPDSSPHAMIPSVGRLGLGTTLAFGVAPRTAVGLTFDFGPYWRVASLPFDGVSFIAGVRWDPPATGYVPGRGKDAQMSTARYLIFLDPCVHRWKFFACAVFGAGQLDNLSGARALRTLRFANLDARFALQGTDFAPPIVVSGGRLGVEVPFLPHLGFRVSGELLGNLMPVTIPIDERSGWTTPRVLGGFEAGLYVFTDSR